MVAFEISQDVVTLITEVRSQQTNLSGSLQVLAEGLKTTTRDKARVEVALATYDNSEVECGRAQEQELLTRLGPKAATFFWMGFEVAVKQFVTQGCPPPGADLDFLDCVAALYEYPPEAFDL